MCLWVGQMDVWDGLRVGCLAVLSALDLLLSGLLLKFGDDPKLNGFYTLQFLAFLGSFLFLMVFAAMYHLHCANAPIRRSTTCNPICSGCSMLAVVGLQILCFVSAIMQLTHLSDSAMTRAASILLIVFSSVSFALAFSFLVCHPAHVTQASVTPFSSTAIPPLPLRAIQIAPSTLAPLSPTSLGSHNSASL